MNVDGKSSVDSTLSMRRATFQNLAKLTSKPALEGKAVDTVLGQTDVPEEQNFKQTNFLTQASNSFCIQLFFFFPSAI